MVYKPLKTLYFGFPMNFFSASTGIMNSLFLIALISFFVFVDCVNDENIKKATAKTKQVFDEVYKDVLKELLEMKAEGEVISAEDVEDVREFVTSQVIAKHESDISALIKMYGDISKDGGIIPDYEPDPDVQKEIEKTVADLKQH